jgi:DNA-binding LacI/PurR family transcriptional regulator
VSERPRHPTSADVAARAGVSRTTVSFVINRRSDVQIPAATWQRVEDAARELGYHPHGPARQLAAGASLTIGLVMRQSAEQVAADMNLPNYLWGLAAAARADGFRVLVEPLAPGDGTYAGLLRSRRADGLIVSGPRDDDKELAALVRDGFPIVIQGARSDLDAPSVDVDNRAGARGAVEHLLRLGHRRIACITNAPLHYTAAGERLQGYVDAMDAAGLEQGPDMRAEGDFEAGSGHLAMATILRAYEPTAVFVASDVVAIGAMRGLRDAGLRVPADVSVVGFDDIPIAAHVDPPLTTVHLPAGALGETAGRLLLDRIAGRPVPSRTLLAIDLVIRDSTASPRKRGAIKPLAGGANLDRSRVGPRT